MAEGVDYVRKRWRNRDEPPVMGRRCQEQVRLGKYGVAAAIHAFISRAVKCVNRILSRTLLLSCAYFYKYKKGLVIFLGSGNIRSFSSFSFNLIFFLTCSYNGVEYIGGRIMYQKRLIWPRNLFMGYLQRDCDGF